METVKRGRFLPLPRAYGPRGRHLVAEEMSAETGFCALRIFEFHDPDPLERLFSDAEETRRHLRDDVIIVRDQFFRVSAFTGTAEGIKR